MHHPFFLGLFFYLATLVITIISILLCFTVVTRLTRYRDLAMLQQNNPAVALVMAAAFVAMAIMLSGAIYPVTAQIQDFWFLGERTAADLIMLLLRGCGYLILAAIISLLSISLAMLAFKRFTQGIDEDQEIRSGNIAVSIVLAGVLIAVALMMRTGVSDFVNTLIPVKNLLN